MTKCIPAARRQGVRAVKEHAIPTVTGTGIAGSYGQDPFTEIEK